MGGQRLAEVSGAEVAESQGQAGARLDHVNVQNVGGKDTVSE